MNGGVAMSAPCYTCLHSDLCPNRETMLGIYNARHQVMIDGSEMSETGDSVSIRVEHRYLNGPALDVLLEGLGFFSNHYNLCKLRHPCPIPPWWADPVKDNGVPVGYIEPLCMDARDCNGNRLAYKDYPYRHSNFGYNCDICPFRGIEYSSQQDEIIKSAASTFYIEYIDTNVGKEIVINDISIPSVIADNYHRSTEANPDSYLIKDESTCIVIYYYYGDSSNDAESGTQYLDHSEIVSRGLSRSITLGAAVTKELAVLSNVYSNIQFICGPIARMNDDDQYNQDDETFSEGDIMYDSGDNTFEKLIFSVVYGDNIKFDVTCDINVRLAKATYSYLDNTIYTCKEEIIGNARKRIYHFEIESFNRSFGFIPIFIPNIINVDDEMTYDLNSLTDFLHPDWGLISGNPPKIRVFPKTQYNGDSDVDYANNLPSNEAMYRPGFKLIGYTTDYKARTDFDSNIDYGEFGDELNNAKHICFASPKVENGIYRSYDAYAMWRVDYIQVQLDMLNSIKKVFSTEVVTEQTDTTMCTYRLDVPYSVTDESIVHMLQDIKINRPGFECDFYTAPEINDGSFTIIDHYDNDKNHTPVVVVFQKDDEGNIDILNPIQLKPLNLDIASELPVGKVKVIGLVYPKDFVGMHAKFKSYFYANFEFNVKPAEVTITEYYEPSSLDIHNSYDALEIKIDGVYEEDKDDVIVIYDINDMPELSGSKASNYTISKRNYLYRYKMTTTVITPSNCDCISKGFVQIDFVRDKETYFFTHEFNAGKEGIKRICIDDQIIYTTDESDEVVTVDNVEFSVEDGKVTIKVFDVSQSSEIDIYVVDCCSSDIVTCSRCKDWIDTSQFDWLTWDPICENYFQV